jgi:protein O-GlcNAc transferase
LAKINDSVIGLWATIMNRVPRSRLLLKAHAFNETATCDRFRELFAAHGVGAERLMLRPNSPHAEMLAEYGDMDIALDPFPFTGGLTTCEALWQGVPVLTLRGETLVARQSSSILAAIGLADWMAEGPGDYAEKATRFARDTDGLARLRASLRRRMTRSSVCEAATFTRDLEQLYRSMWDRWRGAAGEVA